MLVGNVHSRFTHKWLKLETAQVFVNWQMNKKITEFYAILLSNEKEQNIDTHNHMDKSQKHCAKCKKQSIKDYILYDSTYTKLQKRQSYRDRKQISGCLEWLGQTRGVIKRNTGKLFRLMEMLYILIVIVGYMTIQLTKLIKLYT